MRVFHRYIFAWFLIFSGRAQAQYNSSFLNYNATGRSVSVSMDLDAGSNGISNRFADKFLVGGYIDDNLKKSSARHLRSVNNIGANLNYGVTAFIKGSNAIDILIGLKDQVIANSSYTRDLFNLGFYGNQMYEGRTANLGNCSVNLQHFQEIKLGAIFHVTDSATKLGISLSFLKGQQFFGLNTNSNSSLYTSADGSEILFNSNFSMMRSDPKNAGLGAFNGLGASGEIYYETAYESVVGKKSVFIASISNIGSIHWSSSSDKYNSDSTFHYTGYNIRSINDLKDSTLKRINADTILHKVTHPQKRSFTARIPTNLLLINKVTFSGHFAASIGFRYIFSANYRPYFFLEPQYRVKKLTFGLHTGYGGYARLNVGASVTWNNKGWFLKLGSNSLQGYILPNSTFSQGLFFSLAKKLK